MFCKMPVLRTLLDLHKMCINEHDLHVYHALNIRLTCVLKNACFTHVAHFPVLFSWFTVSLIFRLFTKQSVILVNSELTKTSIMC